MCRGCCVKPPVYGCYEDDIAFMSEVSNDLFWYVVKYGVRCGKSCDLPLCTYIKADSTTYFVYAIMMFKVIARQLQVCS